MTTRGQGPERGTPDGPPREIAATRIGGVSCEHGEGPVWDVRAGVLRLVDMVRGEVVSVDPTRPDTDPAHVQRVRVAPFVAALRPRSGGGWIVATERGFARTEEGSWHLAPVAEAFADPAIRMNDGGCDAAGGFLCGSMAYDHTPGAGTLFRLDPDGTVSTVLRDVTISNGFCLDPAGRLAYYVDTPTGRIDVFDVAPDGATLSSRRPFVTMETGAGWPDGLTVDADGGVWVALYGGSAVRGYRPDGTLATVVPIPTPHVTACAFGGADLDDLYITTTQEGLDPAQDPIAGALFRATPGVVGMAPRPYAR